MTKLLVYGYCTGVFSSRRIQKRLQEDIPFKVLAAGNEPDFRTISDFRKIHIEPLENLFEQVLAMALECGSIKLGRVSLDGTKLKANASKHKAMSYGRILSGVSPNLFIMFRLAPLPTRNCMISFAPVLAAAYIAVNPFLLVASTSPPSSTVSS